MPVIYVEVLWHYTVILLAPQLPPAFIFVMIIHTFHFCIPDGMLVMGCVVDPKGWVQSFSRHISSHTLQKVLWVVGLEVMPHVWEVPVVEVVHVLKGHVSHLAGQGTLHAVN